MISGGINIAATLVAIACIDRFGRRPLLLLGSAGMSVCLVLLAYLFGTAPIVEVAATSTCEAPCMQPTLTGGAATLALFAANGFVIFFGFSWGPVVWVLLGEMFPNRIRAIALSVAAAAQWVANFVVSTTFPPLAAKGLGHRVRHLRLLRDRLVLLRLEGRPRDQGPVAGVDGRGVRGVHLTGQTSRVARESTRDARALRPSPVRT